MNIYVRDDASSKRCHLLASSFIANSTYIMSITPFTRLKRIQNIKPKKVGSGPPHCFCPIRLTSIASRMPYPNLYIRICACETARMCIEASRPLVFQFLLRLACSFSFHMLGKYTFAFAKYPRQTKKYVCHCVLS